MSLGSWDPHTEQAKSSLTVDAELLQCYIELSRQGKLDHLTDELDTLEQQEHAGLMQLGTEWWFERAQALGDEEIELLMRFFTKAEQLPGWQAGPNSPVIGLGKVLKQRGTGIPKALIHWIRDNSDNRFLPHGPLL